MLEFMRQSLRGWAGKVLIAIFISPFLFFGASSIFSVFNNATEVAEVNGDAITTQELARTLELNKEQLQQRFGENFDSSVFTDEALRENALMQLINQKLDQQYAESRNLDVSFEKISETIREIPVFHDQSGRFSQDMFERILAQQGMSAKMLIEMIRQDMRAGQIQQIISGSSFVLESEVQDIEALRNQKRDIAFLNLSLEKVKKEIEITDVDIQEYYRLNSQRFMTQENLVIDYLTLKADEFSDYVVIGEEDIVERYENEMLQLKEQQERRAAHILISTDDHSMRDAKAKADELVQLLKQDGDFAELAKKHSADPGSATQGGDLGMAPRGAYVEEFESALYALENKGDVSSPVLTEFGYHIIKLLDVADLEVPTLASQRERIKIALQSREAHNLFQQKLMELEDVVYESPDLRDAANVLGKKVLTSQPFARQVGDGVAEHASVRETAYGQSVLVDKENSPLIELEDGQVIVLRLNTYHPSVLKTLEEVRAEVELGLRRELASEKIMLTRLELMEMLKTGETAAAVAKKAGAEWVSKEQARRNDGDVPREVLDEAFRMPRPAEGDKSVSSAEKRNGDLSIVTVSKVHDGFSELSAQELVFQQQRLNQMSGINAYSKHLDFLREKASIKHKKKQSEFEG